MNKKAILITVGILGVVLVAVLGVGVYYYIAGTKAPVTVETKAPVKTQDEKDLDEIKTELNDKTLETTDLDAEVSELNSLDLSGV